MIPQQVQDILHRHRLRALEFEPGSTPTSVLAAEKIGVRVGQIAKSMLFKAKSGSFFLFVCPGDLRIDNKKIKLTLGVKARMATAEETLSVTGFRPGGVCPFGLDDISIFIDDALAAYEVIYPAAGTDASGVATSFEQLLAITGGRRCDVVRRAADTAPSERG